MINIAICDDDIVMTTDIENRVTAISIEQHILIKCSIFFDGYTRSESIRQGNIYDLIYLDIEMPRVNGIDVAD